MLATTVMVAYCLAVLFTFPLQNFPNLEICTATFGQLISKHESRTKRNTISLVVIVALAFLSYLTMDNLDKVVSLSGSVVGIPLAFVIPPLIQIELNDGLDAWRKGANYCVVCLGLAAMMVCTFSVIKEW